ncbi:hypothetical protein [Christiangramia sp. OXR-203]|uniref:hypothetical protein n=1 Tax=Christiangramia sp. OXR-203 TaxID=3100176 RepID=UPI002AC97CFC|nr:hypothetical protein [Christiangramia sp. OXR-203]WPY98530.1 hypothetical protein T8I65_15300 [Christiangramia sp. OXR-203]
MQERPFGHNLIYKPIGWLYLHSLHSEKTAKSLLSEKFNNRYDLAGSRIVLNLVSFIILAVFVIFVVSLLLKSVQYFVA